MCKWFSWSWLWGTNVIISRSCMALEIGTEANKKDQSGFVSDYVAAFHISWLFTGHVRRATRRVPLVQQKLHTLQQHLSSPTVLSGVRFAQSTVFSVVLCRLWFVSVLCLLPIALSVLLRFMASDLQFFPSLSLYYLR